MIAGNGYREEAERGTLVHYGSCYGCDQNSVLLRTLDYLSKFPGKCSDCANLLVLFECVVPNQEPTVNLCLVTLILVLQSQFVLLLLLLLY